MIDSSHTPVSRRPYTGSCHCGLTKYVVYLSLPPHVPIAHTASETESVARRRQRGQRFYRCNCTLCHKSGLLHVRPENPATDFLLLPPRETALVDASSSTPTLDVDNDAHDRAGNDDVSTASKDLNDYHRPNVAPHLTTYRCATHRIAWLFCRVCGGRCFSFAGEGERVDVAIDNLGLDAATRETLGLAGNNSTVKAWRPLEKPLLAANEPGGTRMYLSINGHSLDAGQAGLDLREWHERGWIMYFDALSADDSAWEGLRHGRPHAGGTY